jgi:hypothetical protein
MAVVGNGNIEVGNTTATRKPGQPIVESLPGSDAALRQTGKTRQGISGAMTQQGDEGSPSNRSVPQKLVHLVGCHDPKPRAEPWVRPRSGPAKP